MRNDNHYENGDRVVVPGHFFGQVHYGLRFFCRIVSSTHGTDSSTYLVEAEFNKQRVHVDHNDLTPTK